MMMLFDESEGYDVAPREDHDEGEVTARIEDIYVSPKSAAPMESRKVATLIAGVGIEGDRYALGKGTYSASFMSEPGRNLTMVSSDAIEEVLAKTNMESFEYRSQLRRNIIVGGLNAAVLNAMVGHEVALGSCRLFVHRMNVPCKYREAQCKRPGLRNNMWEACGICCEIIKGGTVSVGDTVSLVPNTYQPKRINPGRKPPGFFVRPADRTVEMIKGSIVPPYLAAILAFIDPVGFQRLEEGYNSAGQHFWSPKAYRAGLVSKKVRTLLIIAAGVAALAFWRC
uniref:MOSC domain-containing protein n=1 Tax=Pseudictyota dubia TaxID=2749911 RepID=A0A7R9VQ11_9STRA|mmetsp:Transcript_20519/g.38515  ORF Transcript_20519/g.38515 Transcript_20519/m.38515 type:complete len:283 (+) Transcript_20519:131-979(+)|eukprot:CAMPEP_0197433080 /NCGR_PEP_ID=MMETSP1175-20131217/1024_1 /TAXON_ID=1003142 /ORGANISM="Triceratium dubium, Strain CCMP147" /LENGTH=282 /DNA_ID=CAMNT_0042961345 /DNA_START=132 /DNA_END=980 /DNA_ORIENTATION=+